MSVDIKDICNVRTVKKPWGYEKWIADGSPDFRYALKEIFFKANFQTSIQFHEFKEETNFVQKGKGILYFSLEIINIQKFKNGEYSQEHLIQIIESMQKSNFIIHFF